MSSCKCLSIEQIIEIHAYLIDFYGGTRGCYPDYANRIEGVLSQLEPYYEYERYPSIFDKAAALFYYFAKSHIFIDGNKRIAFTVTTVFLEINGYSLSVLQEEAIDISLRIAGSNVQGEQINKFIIKISLWLKKNCV